MQKSKNEKVLRLILLITISILFSGCSTISKNLKDKSVSSGFGVYGLKITAFDPATGTLSPTGWVGWADGYYHSCPVKKGQSFRVSRTTKSFWTGEFSSEIIIEIKAAPANGNLEISGGNIFGIPKAPKAKFTAYPTTPTPQTQN